MALTLRYFTEFGNFRAYCVKVVDKAITMDNLRLLCLVINVCRGTARRPRYKLLADSYVQDLMRSTCLAIVLIRSCRLYELSIGTNIGDLWMTLSGEMAFILRYFTEFGNGPYFALFHRIRVRCRRKKLLNLHRFHFQNLLLIVYDHINTICAIIQRLFRQNKLITRFDERRCIDDWAHCIDYHWG